MENKNPKKFWKIQKEDSIDNMLEHTKKILREKTTSKVIRWLLRYGYGKLMK